MTPGKKDLAVRRREGCGTVPGSGQGNREACNRQAISTRLAGCRTCCPAEASVQQGHDFDTSQRRPMQKPRNGPSHAGAAALHRQYLSPDGFQDPENEHNAIAFPVEARRL